MSSVQTRLLSLLAVFVSLGGLVGLAYWLNLRSQADESETKQQARLLRIESAKEVAELSVSSAEGLSYKVKQVFSKPALPGEAVDLEAESHWQVLEPVHTAADGAVLEGIISHLIGLRHTHTIGNPEGLGEFGLEKPRFVVNIRSRDGRRDVLQVGKKNTFNGDIYVVNRSQTLGADTQKNHTFTVYSVPGSFEYQVDKTVFDIRDKRLAQVDPSKVLRLTVEIAEPGLEELKNFTLIRRGEDYFFKQESDDEDELKADRAQANGMLAALNQLRAREFVAESASPKERAEFGLHAPVATLAVHQEDEPELHFIFGMAAGQSYLTLSKADKPDGRVIALPEVGAHKRFALSLWNLRDKHVLDFNRQEVSRINLQQGDTLLAFEKRPDPEKKRDGWFLAEPVQGNAQDAILEGLLFKLSSMQAIRIPQEKADAAHLAAADLDAPSLTIELINEAGELMDVLHAGAAKGDGRYVRSGMNARLLLVDAGLLADIAADPDSFLQEATTNKDVAGN